MSDDGVRSKKHNDDCGAASYTPLSLARPKKASSAFTHRLIDVRFSVNFPQHLRQHRNRSRINRDIRKIRRKCSDSDDSDQAHNHSSPTHTSQKQSKSYRLLNVILVIALHLICVELVTGVSCDELNDSVGSRGHFTHTWAVHVPGGDEVAESVAADHDMYLRGKVSSMMIRYLCLALQMWMTQSSGILTAVVRLVQPCLLLYWNQT